MRHQGVVCGRAFEYPGNLREVMIVRVEMRRCVDCLMNPSGFVIGSRQTFELLNVERVEGGGPRGISENKTSPLSGERRPAAHDAMWMKYRQSHQLST